MSDNIEKQLKEYFVSNLLFSDDGFQYDDDASFLGEGLIDSLGVMELVNFVASAFMIEVRAEEVTADNFDSIRKLATYIRKKKTAVGAPQTAAAVAAEGERSSGNGL